MKLETKRLILRKSGKKDLEDLVEGMNNLNVSKYLSKVPYPYRKKDAESWINRCKKQFSKDKKEDYPFNIELKEEKKLVGGIFLGKINEFNSSAEIGYWVAEKYWKQGIISEALIKLLDFSYNKLKINRIVIKAYAENKASNAVVKKFGFVYEGTERQAHRCFATKKVHDLNIYSLLKKEWAGVKRRLR